MVKFVLKSCIVCVWWLLCTNPITGQITDHFEDGDYTQNPTWGDDSSAFIVNDGVLQLNAPARDGESFIYMPSKYSIDASWGFKVKMDFNPSSSSYCRVFLMADQSNPDQVSNGYFLKIGGTNDDICLYRKEGSTETLVINGRDKMLNTSKVNSTIKVARDMNGNWELYCDSTGNSDFKLLGAAIDNNLQQSDFFIVECAYIASRSTKFFFDDFEITGKAYSDGTIPALLRFKPISKTKIECTFSEPIADISSGVFLINDTIRPQTIELRENKITLTYLSPFLCKTANHLFISGIKDKWSNCSIDTSVNFSYCTPELFDLVFNEIMADPSPAIDLPDAEYIELYNRSNKTFRTENWNLVVGSSTYLLPDTVIMPSSFTIICAKTVETSFRKYGLTLGLFTSSTTLNNTGQALYLYNSENQMISWLEYSDNWYNNDYKAEGGWSLEQIDTSNPCNGKDNWTASKSKTGGTPGLQNAVSAENVDSGKPEMKKIYVPNDSSILLTFNEPLLSQAIFNAENFVLSANIIPKKVEITGSAYNTILLTLNNRLEQAKVYTLSIRPSIRDCVGNMIDLPIDTIVGVPQQPDSLEIVINEVLFNPYSEKPEYIELYNRSDKILDASNIAFTIESGSNKSTFGASADAFLFYPNSYLVFSPDPDQIVNTYMHCNATNIHGCNNWKALDDKKGTITLQTRNLTTIDKFEYSESMHQQSLTSKEGISLERISIEVATNNPTNWHSAAETVQFGTPGLLNSQYIAENNTTETFTIENELFSPDNDSYNDVLKVMYHFDRPGFRISAWVFDAIGRKKTCLLNNALPESSGFFTWDGQSEEGKRCTPGMYIIFIRLVNDDGEVKEYKKACVLALKR